MHKAMLRLLAVVALLAGAAATTAQPPDRPDRDKRGGPPGGPPRFVLGKVLPPFAVDQLDLTAEQKDEIAKLEKEVKQRLEKILTADQRKKLETLRPPRPGGPPGGPDAPPPPEGERRPPKKAPRPEKPEK